MKPVLEKSEQAIYLYLHDNHKVRNKKFADLIGYKSPKEWADAEAPLSDVGGGGKLPPNLNLWQLCLATDKLAEHQQDGIGDTSQDNNPRPFPEVLFE